MKLHRFLLPLAAVMLLLSSCSKRSELLETIPADAQAVVAVNAVKLMNELQIKADGSSVTLPPQLQSKLDADADRLKVLAAAGAAVDLEHVFLAYTKATEAYAVFTVKDADAFGKAMEDGGLKRDSDSGCDVYAGEGFSVVVNDGTGWILDAGKQGAKTVKDILKRASDKSMAEVEGVASRLSGDALAYVAFNPGRFYSIKGKEDAWGVFDVNVKDNAIKGEVVSIDAKGNLIATKGMTRIDTSVLRYLPFNSAFVTAFGISKDADWDAVMSNIAGTGTLNAAQQAQMQMIVPYLKALDGTVMFAMSPKPGLDNAQTMSRSFGDYDLIAMMHMEQSTADQAVAALKALAAQMGGAREVEKDLFTVSFEGQDMYFGKVDGYLTFSTMRPTECATKGMEYPTSHFNGKEGCMRLSLLSMHTPFLPGANFGVDFVINGAGQKASYSLKLLGNDAPILLTLLQL